MKRIFAPAAVLAATSLVMVASPASAAPVDYATFESQISVAAQAAFPDTSKAINEKISLTVNGAKFLDADITINPDSSLIGVTTGLGVTSHIRCLPGGATCYTREAGKKMWKKEKSTDPIQYSELFTTVAGVSDSFGPNATFDITDNVYTVTDSENGENTVITVSPENITANVTATESGATSNAVMTIVAVAPVKVTKPASKLIIK